MATTTKKPSVEYIQDGEIWYIIVTDACGNKSDPVEVPCPCSDGDGSPGSVNNGDTYCRKLGKVSRDFYEFFERFCADVMDGWQTLGYPGIFAGCMKFIADEHIDIKWFNKLLAMAQLVTIDQADSIQTLIGNEDYIKLASIIHCCTPDEVLITDATLACIKVTMRTPASPVAGYSSDWQNYFAVFGNFIGVFDTEFWAYRAFLAQDDEPYDAFLCEDLAACGSILNCSDYLEITKFYLTAEDNDWSGLVAPAGYIPDAEFNGTGSVTYPINTIRTSRAFEVVNECLPQPDDCYTAAVVKYFETPITLCNAWLDVIIFASSNPSNITRHTGNTSVMGIFYQVDGSTDWLTLDVTKFGINYPNLRRLHWFGAEVVNVTGVLMAHKCGGKTAAIMQVAINEQSVPDPTGS